MTTHSPSRARCVLAVFGIIGLALGCASGSGPAPSGAAARIAEDASATLEQQVMDLVNQYRVRESLSALSRDADATAIAREHSDAMASGQRKFGHAGFAERVQSVITRSPA